MRTSGVRPMDSELSLKIGIVNSLAIGCSLGLEFWRHYERSGASGQPRLLQIAADRRLPYNRRTTRVRIPTRPLPRPTCHHPAEPPPPTCPHSMPEFAPQAPDVPAF